MHAQDGLSLGEQHVASRLIWAAAASILQRCTSADNRARALWAARFSELMQVRLLLCWRDAVLVKPAMSQQIDCYVPRTVLQIDRLGRVCHKSSSYIC